MGDDVVPAAARHIALVGLSGTGKSAVAARLAERTGRRLVDTDRLVEVEVGHTVAEEFAAAGEASFREREMRALVTALSGPPACVATGGGIVTLPEARALLARRCDVVWLRADPSVLAERLAGTTEARPLLGDDAETALRELLRRREPLYREVADSVVDVGGMDVEDVVERIVADTGAARS